MIIAGGGADITAAVALYWLICQISKVIDDDACRSEFTLLISALHSNRRDLS